jgi:hypothetical protein
VYTCMQDIGSVCVHACGIANVCVRVCVRARRCACMCVLPPSRFRRSSVLTPISSAARTDQVHHQFAGGQCKSRWADGDSREEGRTRVLSEHVHEGCQSGLCVYQNCRRLCVLQTNTHTHKHTHTRMCVCVNMCAKASIRSSQL